MIWTRLALHSSQKERKKSHTPGPLFLWISVVWFSLVHIFKNQLKYPAYVCNFHYIIKGIPSLRRFWLLMLWIWFMQIFARPKKKHEPRTGCKSSLNQRSSPVKSALRKGLSWKFFMLYQKLKTPKPNKYYFIVLPKIVWLIAAAVQFSSLAPFKSYDACF